MLTEKIPFQNRGLAFYYPPRPPFPLFGKRPHLFRLFFRNPSLREPTNLTFLLKSFVVLDGFARGATLISFESLFPKV